MAVEETEKYGGVKGEAKNGKDRKQITEPGEKIQEKAYAHWMYRAAGAGSKGFMKKLDQLGNPREIYGLACRGLLEKRIEKISEERYQEKYCAKAAQITTDAHKSDVMDEYEEMRDRGINFILREEEQFPQRLAAISDTPYGIYYAGKLPEDCRPAIAVIGARNCSAYGRYMAKEFGAALAAAGVQVISGMARGIDGIGQTAALDAGGYSAGVLGCGVDICYPAEHRSLYEKLIATGGICSEYPPGTEPKAMLFPPRNRIISGLCDGVLVIEAKERSGTLITVDMALEQGREVYALPGRATDPLSAGCHRLISQGAELVTMPQQLLQNISAVCTNDRQQMLYEQQNFFAEGGTRGKVMHLMDFQPRSINQLLRAYEETYGDCISIPELCSELMQLCTVGYVGQTGGGFYTIGR